ncbi:hypothetical protein [Mesorhizobium sp. M0208]|uniref:hypothetical protein n=1 Tax=Mesorhizobium sp. M0208 TaxID=2956916 RepID=UPI00333C5F78
MKPNCGKGSVYGAPVIIEISTTGQLLWRTLSSNIKPLLALTALSQPTLAGKADNSLNVAFTSPLHKATFSWMGGASVPDLKVDAAKRKAMREHPPFIA